MRKIGLLGDIHVGSRYGLSPEYWAMKDGPEEQVTQVRCNSAQDLLREYFTDLMEVQYRDCDTIILLGDLCDGPNRKEHGRNLASVELNRQVDYAVRLIEPYIKGRTILSVDGSGYHQSEYFSLDGLVADRLKDKGHSVKHRQMWNVHFEGTKIHANIIHSSGGASIYRETVSARELLFAEVGEKHLGVPINLFIRGHWHWFYHGEYKNKHIVYNAGFKLLYPSKMLTGFWARYIPTLGGCVIELDGDKITVEKKLYPGIKLLEDFITV